MGSNSSEGSGFERVYSGNPRGSGVVDRGGNGGGGGSGGFEAEGGGGGGRGGPNFPVNLHLMRRESDSSSSLSREQVRS